jgi:hypothetical protein
VCSSDLPVVVREWVLKHTREVFAVTHAPRGLVDAVFDTSFMTITTMALGTRETAPVDYYVSSVDKYSTKKGVFIKKIGERYSTGAAWPRYEVVTVEYVNYSFLVRGVTDESRDAGKGVVRTWAVEGAERICGESTASPKIRWIPAKVECVEVKCVKYVGVDKRGEADFDLVPEENYRYSDERIYHGKK